MAHLAVLHMSEVVNSDVLKLIGTIHLGIYCALDKGEKMEHNVLFMSEI